MAAFDSDHLADDLYAVQSLDFAKLAKAGERLWAAATLRTGARSLDILHVAAAALGAYDGFLTFDDRQREVARIAGLAMNSPPQ